MNINRVAWSEPGAAGPQDLLDLACANLTDNPGLTTPSASVFLDIQPSLPILKGLFLPQPLTSIQEVPQWTNLLKWASRPPDRTTVLLGVYQKTKGQDDLADFLRLAKRNVPKFHLLQKR